MTSLPYNLGGNDDPFFEGDGVRPMIDAGGNFIPDRVEANEERYAPSPDELGDWYENDTSGLIGGEEE